MCDGHILAGKISATPQETEDERMQLEAKHPAETNPSCLYMSIFHEHIQTEHSMTNMSLSPDKGARGGTNVANASTMLGDQTQAS